MVFCHWITAGYTSHCFNVFSVSKPFMLLSLCYTVTLSLAAPLISYFIRLLSLTASNQAFNKRNDVWATWNNWTEVQSISHHNWNSVILGLGKSNKGNISWIRTGTEGRGARESLLSISGANLEVNTWNDMSTRTFTWSGMSLPAPWDTIWSQNVSQILDKFLTMKEGPEKFNQWLQASNMSHSLWWALTTLGIWKQDYRLQTTEVISRKWFKQTLTLASSHT